MTLPDDLPIAIWHCGDPHQTTQASTCDSYMTSHRARNLGMYGGNVGDTTNNWVGKLARLHAQQETTAAESWALAEDTGALRLYRSLREPRLLVWATDSLRWICASLPAPAPVLGQHAGAHGGK